MKTQVALLFVVLVLVSVGAGCGSKKPPADASLGDTWTRPNDEMVMVYVPEGEFEMGSTEAQVELVQPWLLQGCSTETPRATSSA